MPAIEGLADFTGPVLHTSRWDDAIALAGKRVAVIGTGASGVQVIPELAEVADRVTVFQRTPPWMVPKDDRHFSAEELARFRDDPSAMAAERERIWQEFHVNTAVAADDPLVVGRQGYAKAFLDAQVDRRSAARTTHAGLSVPMQAGAARRRLLPGVAT